MRTPSLRALLLLLLSLAAVAPRSSSAAAAAAATASAAPAAAAASAAAAAAAGGGALPTLRPARGDVPAGTFQDQVRAPPPRGVPEPGTRRRSELDLARALAAAQRRLADGALGIETSEEDDLAADAEAEEAAALAAVFAPRPEEKEAPLLRASGGASGRAPFWFEDDEDLLTMAGRAFDRVALDIAATAALAAGAGNADAPAAEPVVYSDDLRQWADFAMNPDGLAVGEDEQAALDESFVGFLRRQGMAPPARMAVHRGFVTGHVATAWLKDTAAELAVLRLRAAALRRILADRAAKREREAAAAAASAKADARAEGEGDAAEVGADGEAEGVIDALGI